MIINLSCSNFGLELLKLEILSLIWNNAVWFLVHFIKHYWPNPSFGHYRVPGLFCKFVSFVCTINQYKYVVVSQHIVFLYHCKGENVYFSSVRRKNLLCVVNIWDLAVLAGWNVTPQWIFRKDVLDILYKTLIYIWSCTFCLEFYSVNKNILNIFDT